MALVTPILSGQGPSSHGSADRQESVWTVEMWWEAKVLGGAIKEGYPRQAHRVAGSPSDQGHGTYVTSWGLQVLTSLDSTLYELEQWFSTFLTLC